jgi:hypothetical protein
MSEPPCECGHAWSNHDKRNACNSCDCADYWPGVFVRLTWGNDWGFSYLCEEGKRLTPTGFADAKLGIYFTEGQSVRIRYPDLTVEDVTIRIQKKKQTVGDHGHDSEVTYPHAGFVADHRGQKIWIGIDQVEVLRRDLPARRFTGIKRDACTRTFTGRSGGGSNPPIGHLADTTDHH